MLLFRHIGHRLLFAVGLVVALGIASVVLLYAQRQEQSILAQNERALTHVTDSAIEGLRAIMLRGYAEIAHDYAKRLKGVNDVLDYRFLRVDGSEAFIDNLTIDSVNTKLGEQVFIPRSNAPPAPLVLDRKDRRIAVMLARGDHVIFYETTDEGERTVTIIEPIKNTASCHKCHPNTPVMRGMVKLTTSLKTVEADIAATWRMSMLVVLVGVMSIFLIVWIVAQRAVVRPIRQVTDAMSIAAGGDLSVSVPVTGGNEIGTMAGSFNQMSGQLLNLYSGFADEQNKLTTIVLSAREGIIVTDAKKNIVLVNPDAIELLGKSEELIIQQGFLHIVDNPQWMQDRLLGSLANTPVGYIDYRGKTLMIQTSTIRDTSGEITGSTALLRDVTEEKRLAAELQRASITDVLTGLFNRRHFDTCLSDEFKRWKRFQSAFSIAMLDVDHFKKFNDTHGHDCGDRVLQSIGSVLKNIETKGCIACRYGGEELIVIFPDLHQDAAIVIADHIRQQIEALIIDGLRVTVSIGVAGSPPQVCDTPEEILKLADEALYVAKENGRNRVIGA